MLKAVKDEMIRKSRKELKDFEGEYKARLEKFSRENGAIINEIIRLHHDIEILETMPED